MSKSDKWKLSTLTTFAVKRGTASRWPEDSPAPVKKVVRGERNERNKEQPDVQVRLQDGRVVLIPHDWLNGIFPKGSYKTSRFKARFIEDQCA